MFRTQSGIRINESNGQLENADPAMCESLEPCSNVTVERLTHLSKQRPETISTDDGMQIVESVPHLPNANPPMIEIKELLSNLTEERFAQSKKQ
jgi:hypothetical protein